MTYFFIDDGVNPDTIYGDTNPYCISESELDWLAEEFGDEVRDQFHEAWDWEIERYGFGLETEKPCMMLHPLRPLRTDITHTIRTPQLDLRKVSGVSHW